MKVINKSRKVIGINGEPLLPGKTMDLPEGAEKHPAIADYLKKGILVDSAKADMTVSAVISDSEKARIAEEAIANYKAQQAELEAKRAAKEAEIKDAKGMNKGDLQLKAATMGIKFTDDTKAEDLKKLVVDALTAELEKIGQ